MLIRYSITNFLSFNESTTISLVPGEDQLKLEHKTKPIKGISALKTSLIFGANASGKSNLIKAIAFGQSLVLKGTQSDGIINYQKFRLDTVSIVADSRMEYEIQHKGINYAYGFVFNSNEIVEEWLYVIGVDEETKVFERTANNTFNLDKLYETNKKEEEQQFIQFIAKGTPSNQLFLTEIRTRRVKDNVSDIRDLLNVIDWFTDCLAVIFPNDSYKEELKRVAVDNDVFTTLLKYFDTGIDGVCLEEISLDQLKVPEKVLDRVRNDLLTNKSKKSKMIIVTDARQHVSYFLTQEKDDIIAHKFMTQHQVKGQDGKEKFDLRDESDGTNRIIDLIPLLIDLLQGDKVFIVDEMERSLHPNLICDLFDLFLGKSTDINSQLIVATHESSLLNHELFRKDEIWFTVKVQSGATHLHSLEEYDVLFDTETQKDYLKGRFKAIPRLGGRSSLTFLEDADATK